MPTVEDVPPRRLAYDIVDVFAAQRFAGNPLAVVHGADGLSTAQLQALAREFNLSETAFPVAASDRDRAAGATYALRIFTPVTELPYAGHPSIGTAWVLRDQGRLRAGRVVQACGAGLLPLDLATDGGPIRLTGGAPTWTPPRDPRRPWQPSACRLPPWTRTLEPRICGVGLPYFVLPVRPEALADCRPDLGRLAAFAHPVGESSGVFVVAWEDATARARMFAGDIATAEDAATGSAAGALAVWLAVSSLVPDGETAFTVAQGVEMGRPSRIDCTVTVDAGTPVGTTVAGNAIHVASGTIAVPD